MIALHSPARECFKLKKNERGNISPRCTVISFYFISPNYNKTKQIKKRKKNKHSDTMNG